MKLIRSGMIGCALLLQCVACWAVYGVRISDLSHSPTPTNPIRVWGKVTSVSPLKLNDGKGEIQVSGLTASLDEFLVVTGNWNGTVLTVPFVPDMIYIPAGSFDMGNSGVGDDAAYGYSCEFPQHTVTLSEYYICKNEVTRWEYAQFMSDGGYSNPTYWSTDGWSWKVSENRTEPSYWAAYQDWSSPYSDGNGFTQTDNHPVIGVSYYEAEAFCNWAGGHLPTEAQWERAARCTGTHLNVYPWDDTLDHQKYNNWCDSLYPGYQTAPVGSYPSGASPSGCHDMAGNVWEWCLDWYKSYSGSSTPFDDTNIHRVLRGGGWYNSGYSDRCAFRNGCNPNDYYSTGGFRLAR